MYPDGSSCFFQTCEIFLEISLARLIGYDLQVSLNIGMEHLLLKVLNRYFVL